MRRVTGDTDQQRFSLQRRAAGVGACRRDEEAMWCVYVLELGADEEGRSNWYVGYTESGIMRRLHDHMTGSQRSCAWVRRWGAPLVGVEVRAPGAPPPGPPAAEELCGCEELWCAAGA